LKGKLTKWPGVPEDGPKLDGKREWEAVTLVGQIRRREDLFIFPFVFIWLTDFDPCTPFKVVRNVKWTFLSSKR
jgi:hypothetical protein